MGPRGDLGQMGAPGFPGPQVCFQIKALVDVNKCILSCF